MKDILALIEEKKQAYSQLPLFEFLQDQSIHPAKRLAFAPCAAPFIMSFSDLCKYVLRQEPTNDKIQSILNQHTYEDDFHWQWFIEDLEQLGVNYSLPLSDSLIFLWNEKTKASRFLTHELYRYITQSEALDKLIIMEAMEATADILLSCTKQITSEMQLTTNQEYKYFGSYHYDSENSHNTRSHEVRNFMESIYISETNKQKSIDIVEKVFELFTQWTYSLLSYAQDYQVSQPLNLLNQEQILELA